MPGNRSPGRMIAYGAAVLLLIFGAYCLLSLRARHADLQRSLRFTYPLALGADFSSAGEYRASFVRGPAHYVKRSHLGLDVPETVLSGTSPDTLLAGLEATYTIVDADGEKVYSGPLAAHTNKGAPRGFPNVIRLTDDLRWYPKGLHRIDATVMRGAPALKGVPQRLVLAIDDGRIADRGSNLHRLAFLGFGSLSVAVVILVSAAL